MSHREPEKLERQDVEALLETRHELGPTYEQEIVDSFAERIERAVEERVDARLAHRGGDNRADAGGQVRQFVLGVISLGAGIPVTIVPLVAADSLAGAVIGWAGIVAVNAAHAASLNGPRRNQRPR